MSRPKSQQNYFKQLEKFIGSKFPSFIINFLVSSGFDTELALISLKESSIDVIESHLNQNRIFAQATVYEHQQPIKLLPGHKAIILEIPKYVEQLKSNRKGSRKSTKQIDIIDSAQKLDEIKDKLIVKVSGYISKIQLHLNLIDDCVIGLKYVSNQEYKCHFKCPACQKLISCIFKNYWMISNVQSHLKDHTKEAIIIPLNENENEVQELIQQANNSINAN